MQEIDTHAAVTLMGNVVLGSDVALQMLGGLDDGVFLSVLGGHCMMVLQHVADEEKGGGCAGNVLAMLRPALVGPDTPIELWPFVLLDH